MIDEQVYFLLNLLLKVIIISLIVSAPFLLITLEMYAYDRYKKWKNTEQQDFERIIVGKVETKENLEKSIEELQEQERRKALDVELLEIKLKAYNLIELPEIIQIEQPAASEETIKEKEHESTEKISEELTINELKTIAKKKGVKGYSKKSKEELIKVLNNLDE